MQRRWTSLLQYLKNSHELLTILLFYLAIAGFQLGGPDVSVTYDVQDLLPAAKLSEQLDQSNPVPPAEPALRSSVQAFTNSKNFVRVEIVNKTHSRITDVEVSLVGVTDAADAAVSSTSPSMRSDAKTLAEFKLADNIVLFPNLKELPPRARVTVMLWGKVLPPMFGDSVRVSAAVPRIQVVERQTASGFGLFVARNVGVITFLLVMYFLLAALGRTRRARELADANNT